jgi:uncharacterized protein YyaL (SSP411 family)
MKPASSTFPIAPAGNRLAGEKSPYLLQHAGNPVAWNPWGEEAFARARAEDKPIFLSIGYSTCHWCHVMAHESFEDPATAAVMNELFVNIKLDREERPDIDRVYMTFVQASTGSGGWPMSVWLQPDLKPFFGGTYFPPDDRYGRRGFATVCCAVGQAWRQERGRINAQSERILESLRDYARAGAARVAAGQGSASERPFADILREAGEPLAQSYDPEWGGFGTAPKFPRPVTLYLLARIHAQARRRDGEGDGMATLARTMLEGTLARMAAGGMHDQLGGGFHRYSVDRFWHVPHFEKMLYDQAQLAIAYLEAFQITGEAAHAETVRDILAYVRRDLTSPEGGFYCAEDADSLLAAGRPEHAEGAFYVWTKAEIEEKLTAGEAAAICEFYGVEAQGNAPPGSDPQGEFTGKNILFRPQTMEAGTAQVSLLSSAREKLLSARSQRPRPHLDDKIVTAWNGLMISAFARAYQVLGDDAFLDSARRAAEFVRTRLYQPESGTLLRSYREGPATVAGFADDYAFLIQGLLNLYEAAFDASYLLWAIQLQERQDDLFLDREEGGYFAAAAGDASVLLRLKEDHDGAEPSASSVSALNLARLAALTGRDELRERAVATVRAFGALENPARTAQTMPMLLVAADFLSEPPLHLVVAGRRDAADTRALLAVGQTRFLPRLVVLLADDGSEAKAVADELPFVATAVMKDGRATAYLCEHGACQLPTSDPAQLAEQLDARH